ncbi:MAG: EscU/YscU/HrcU family type III secretion system export apparatus switch protein [Planctomycetota bacterium]|nr:EscU/YscU/HrcU family type III secretion system export apparatus switch protein [Planctomycetota bacterium]
MVSTFTSESSEPIDRQIAVALRYRQPIDRSPRVLARGHGRLAQRIIDSAQEAGIPLREDADLATVLSHIPLNAEIPPRLYRVVAEVLAWVYETNRDFRDRLAPPND